MPGPLSKNILVTGAAGNLGKAVVQKFLSEGFRVIAIVSPGSKMTSDVKGDLNVMEADLSQEKSSEELVKKVLATFKSIDAALLLAGGYDYGSIYETDGAKLHKMISLNFETAYYVARPTFSQMLEQASGGRIIFIGARPALLPKDGKSSVAYALSKSLVFKLSDFLNAEGASRNVLCSVVVPSTIDTPANRKAMPNADFSSWVTPEAIADVIYFAVSDKAGTLKDSVYKVYGNA
ncbi:3-oxoacyl-ACP reductase FabG [soil metagenome]